MERSTCTVMLWGALMVSWVAAAPCAAQPPELPSQRPPGAIPEPVPGLGPISTPSPPTVSGPNEGMLPAGRSPLDTGVKLPIPQPLPNDFRFPINLATALRLSDARPLIVAAAQAGVWVAEADLTLAKVLWVPQLNLGFDYIRHDGGGPDFNKGILTAVSTNFFYAGGGLTGPLFGTIYTADALYQPLVARQLLNARHFDIQTAKNDAVLRTADAYFRVHQQRGMYAGLLYCLERGHELVERIATMSRDLVPEVEVERARNLLADLQQRTVIARQEWRVQSANLTQVLRLEPRAVVEPVEHDHLQITLIDPGKSLDELMPIAMKNRPELASNQALVRAAEAAIRREIARPLLPNIILNGFQTPFEQLQAGIFGFGANTSMNQWTGRDDFSIQPLWQLTGVGIGNLAMIKRQRGQQSQAIIELFRSQDMVAADVTRALARVQSAAARVYFADRSLRTGIITLNGNFEGLSQIQRFGDVLVLINRPQEAVYALQLLNRAFDEYFTTVAEYNRAQFELFHALGYPAREVTYLRPPGNIEPVETNRPAFLPPVGNGPPPATR